jgi:hypothetical protein
MDSKHPAWFSTGNAATTVHSPVANASRSATVTYVLRGEHESFHTPKKRKKGMRVRPERAQADLRVRWDYSYLLVRSSRYPARDLSEMQHTTLLEHGRR